MIKKINLFPYILLFVVCLLYDVHSQSWQYMNGPYGGEVRSAVVNSSDVTFVGTRNGVFRSTNLNEKWQHVGLVGMIIWSMALDNLTNRIYAGTWEDGLFRSNDNGETWELLGFADGGHVDAIAVDSNGRIYVAAGKVYYSSNDGASWEFGISGSISSIAFSPNGNIFMSARTSRGGIFKSTDQGKTWNKVLETNSANSVTTNSSGHIFVADVGAVYRSLNDGNSWETLRLPQGFYENILINSLGHIFVSTSVCNDVWNSCGIFKSTDDGDTWTQVNNTLPSSYGLVVTSGDHIISATIEGIFDSSDGGISWIPRNSGLAAVNIKDMAKNLEHDIFASTDIGIFRLKHDELSWEHVSLPHIPISDIEIDNLGTVYAGIEFPILFDLSDTDIFISLDNGDSWETSSNFIGNSTSIALNSKNNDILVGTNGFGEGVFLSSDSGDSWEYVGLRGNSVTDLIIDSNGEMFVATNSSRGSIRYSIFSTNDYTLFENTVWSSTQIDKFISNLAISPSGRIYAGGNGLFASDDKGKSWQLLGQKLVSSIEFGESELIYIGGDGVKYSTDAGRNWTELNNGLGYTSVKSLVVDNESLYAGTQGGVFKIDIGGLPNSVDTSEFLPQAYFLHQNYPNPFNPYTTIRFEVSRTSFVKIEIYNLRGEKIETIVSEVLPQGQYEVKWSPLANSSGIYFYKMEADHFRDFKQLAFIK